MEMKAMTKEEFERATGKYKLCAKQALVAEFIHSGADYAEIKQEDQTIQSFQASFNFAAKRMKANCYCIVNRGRIFIVRGKRPVSRSEEAEA